MTDKSDRDETSLRSDDEDGCAKLSIFGKFTQAVKEKKSGLSSWTLNRSGKNRTNYSLDSQ